MHEEKEAKEREVEQLKPCQPATQPMRGRQGSIAEEEQRVWFVEGGKIPSFGILPRPLLGDTLLGKCTYQNG